MNSYLLFKSLHLIAVVSWMAGLLYLPRIFVYHVENKEKKEATDIFEVMEKKLFYYIMRPSDDLYLDLWFSSHLFKWYRDIFSTMDANKNCSSYFVVSL
jgi:uncharacterized integral membrane protein (TIGR00701 family)